MSRTVLVRQAAVPTRAEYCRCTTVRNYDYDEAAEKLRCKVRFLQDRISSLPHQRLGESVAFCECELAIIQALFSILPDQVGPALDIKGPQETPSSTVPSIRSIRPAGRKRRGA
ncbi:hypothetical protein [Streptomyces sp. NPDC058548]|uniref:hypothetical protein n=1 Tax=Streptomyces sp. NPDC058548 TaxID=3346545 RepID=UPI0036553271